MAIQRNDEQTRVPEQDIDNQIQRASPPTSLPHTICLPPPHSTPTAAPDAPPLSTPHGTYLDACVAHPAVAVKEQGRALRVQLQRVCGAADRQDTRAALLEAQRHILPRSQQLRYELLPQPHSVDGASRMRR